jgi:O-antigen/teichoic acid export membrane protein
MEIFTYRFNKLKQLEYRNKLLLKNVAGSVMISGISMIIGFITLRVYLKYFNNQDVLGVWLTLLSILTWIVTFDLGIGNGLRNYLAKALAEKRYDKAQKYISSAYVSITFLCTLIIIVTSIIFSFIPWNKILNISEELIGNSVLIKAILILLVGTLVRFVFKLISSIMLAVQMSVIPNVLTLISNMALLIYVLASTPKDMETNIINISIFYAISINLPLLITTFYSFSTHLKHCSPKLKSFDYNCSKDIVKLGSTFLILQLMSMIINGTNNFLIIWFIGPSQVVQYQVYYKLFSLISTVFMIVLGPIWSAVTQEYAKKEYNWILNVQSKLFKLLMVGFIGELVMIVLSKSIVKAWMGANFSIAPVHLIVAIAISDALFIIWNINAFIANGMSKVKLQMKLATLGAIINVPLAYLISLFIHDASAVIFANIISVLPYCLTEPISIRNQLKNDILHHKKGTIKDELV